MKKIKVLLIGLGTVAAAAGIVVFAFGTIYQATSEHTTCYYSRIDNNSVTEITPHGGMNYQYYLHAYQENGEAEDMTMDTSRVLRDGAFIRMEVAPLRGVISWAELLYQELPAAVQAKYKE